MFFYVLTMKARNLTPKGSVYQLFQKDRKLKMSEFQKQVAGFSCLSYL
ncbi:hypothetical protein [Peribacillus sp. NPDC097895]